MNKPICLSCGSTKLERLESVTEISPMDVFIRDYLNKDRTYQLVIYYCPVCDLELSYIENSGDSAKK